MSSNKSGNISSNKSTHHLTPKPSRLTFSKVQTGHLQYLIPTLLILGIILYLRELRSRSSPGAHLAKSKGATNHVRRPPHLLSWIPWLGCALALSKDPDSFISSATARLGPIFSVIVAGRKMMLITSPSAISYIYKNPKIFQFYKIRREMAITVFGQRREIDGDHIHELMFPGHKRFFQPNAIKDLVDDFATHLEKEIERTVRRVQEKGGEEIVGAHSLVYECVYNASVHAFAGPTFPDVNSLSSFLEFDKGFPLLAGELPAFMTKPTVKAREAAIDRIVEWVESVKAAGLDESKVGGAPRFLIEYAEEVGASTRDQACWVLMDVWALVANAPQAAIWALVRFSEHPQHLVRLREEIASGLKQAGGDIHTLLHSPAIFNSETFAFTTSAINETLRESSSVFSMRVVEEDTVLPENLDGCGGYLLKKGESVFCVTRSTHVDGDVYDDPNEWIPDRFMPGQRKGSKKVSNDYMPFGGGVSICEGRHFAMQELRIFLIAFFYSFDVTPVSPEKAKIDHSRGVGMGVMWLKEGYKIRLRARDNEKQGK